MSSKSSVILSRISGKSQSDATTHAFRAAGLRECVGEGELVALKMHFGEWGNTQVISPFLVASVVQEVREAGGNPFVVDANTIYRGRRSNAVEHLECAYRHGYSPEALGAPVIIADGLRGRSFVEVPVPGGKRLDRAKIASDIYYADGVIALTHVTGHGMFGLGGSIKNMGMGSGSRGGKQMMHSDVTPVPDADKCDGCRVCAQYCPAGAISYPEPDGKARIDKETCIGCGECVAMCPVSAIAINWGETVGCQERTAETCAALMNGRRDKFGFMNFIITVSPDCDCMSRPGTPFVPDVGVAASTDPVALDLATVAIVNQQPSMPGSAVESVKPPGDKFRSLYPDVDWEIQARRLSELGMGSYDYEVEEV